MTTNSAKNIAKDAGIRIAMAVVAGALLITAAGAAAEDRPVRPRPGFGTEIEAQGAAALQEMTLHLKPGLDWGKQGAEALAVVLEHQAVTDQQVAGNPPTDCERCHENRERG